MTKVGYPAVNCLNVIHEDQRCYQWLHSASLLIRRTTLEASQIR
jgi:hypothetical protein